MANFIMWLPTIVKVGIDIVKFIIELKKQGKSPEECKIAVKDAIESCKK